jgi:hypothetical protein
MDHVLANASIPDRHIGGDAPRRHRRAFGDIGVGDDTA